MIILNFTHPLTDKQRVQIEQITGQAIMRVIDILAQFDNNQPFAGQIAEMVDGVELSPTQWQTEPILMVPPAFNFIAVTLLAELHGRMGYFPPVVRLRPVEGSLAPRYEVAEVINLQTIRDTARHSR